MPTLLDLPDDLLDHIFRYAFLAYSRSDALLFPYVRSPDSFLLATLCRRLYDPIMNVLYRHVYVASYHTLQRLSQTLHASTHSSKPLGSRIDTVTLCMRDSEDSVDETLPSLAIYYVFYLLRNCTSIVGLELEYLDLQSIACVPAHLKGWGLSTFPSMKCVSIQRFPVIDNPGTYHAYASISLSIPSVEMLRYCQVSFSPCPHLPSPPITPLHVTNPSVREIELREFSAPDYHVYCWLYNHPRLRKIILSSVPSPNVEIIILASAPKLTDIHIQVFDDEDDPLDPDWMGRAHLHSCDLLERLKLENLRIYPGPHFISSLPSTLQSLTLTFTNHKAAIPARELLSALMDPHWLPSLSYLSLRILQDLSSPQQNLNRRNLPLHPNPNPVNNNINHNNNINNNNHNNNNNPTATTTTTTTTLTSTTTSSSQHPSQPSANILAKLKKACTTRAIYVPPNCLQVI